MLPKLGDALAFIVVPPEAGNAPTHAFVDVGALDFDCLLRREELRLLAEGENWNKNVRKRHHTVGIHPTVGIIHVFDRWRGGNALRKFHLKPGMLQHTRSLTLVHSTAIACSGVKSCGSLQREKTRTRTCTRNNTQCTVGIRYYYYEDVPADAEKSYHVE